MLGQGLRRLARISSPPPGLVPHAEINRRLQVWVTCCTVISIAAAAVLEQYFPFPESGDSALAFVVPLFLIWFLAFASDGMPRLCRWIIVILGAAEFALVAITCLYRQVTELIVFLPLLAFPIVIGWLSAKQLREIRHARHLTKRCS